MESIDLTWGGFFGGIGDGSDENRNRNFEDPLQAEGRFSSRNPFIDSIISGMTLFQPLLEEKTGGEIDQDHMLTMIELFDDLNPTIYQNFDPYANMGHFCDCCGKAINILSGRYFLCYECDDKLDQDILNRSSSEEFIDTL